MPGLGFIERFFGAETHPYRLGLVRIPIGMVGLLAALVTRVQLAVLFSPDALRVPQFAWLPELEAAYSDVYIGVWILAALLFTVGLFSRPAGTVVALCIAYRFALDQTLYTTNIYLCGLLTAILVIGNAGAAISLDQTWRGKGRPSVPRWPETLFKLQISLVYLFTAIEKINPRVVSGDGYRHFLAMPGFLDQPFVYPSMAVAIILFELALPFALWSRRVRGWAVLCGLVFHSAILVLFSLSAGFMAYSTMFVGSYFLFIDDEPGSRRIAGPAKLVSWLRRLDWLRIYNFEPGSRTLSVRAGRIQLTGWTAFRETLTVLPISCLWAAALRLPLLAGLGRWMYDRFVAKGFTPMSETV